MSVLGRQAFSLLRHPLLLFLVGWTLIDLAAIPLTPLSSNTANLIMRAGIGVAGNVCFITALIVALNRSVR